jgi:hypothetical protein
VLHNRPKLRESNNPAIVSITGSNESMSSKLIL